MKNNLYYSWSDIKKSSLLPPERINELEIQIQNHFEDVFDSSGKKLKGVKSYYLIEGGEKISYIFNEKTYQASQDYYIRCILAFLLTENELEIISKFCLQKLHSEMEEKYLKHAKTINISEYSGRFYYNDKIFEDYEELKEYLDEIGQNPEYVWAVRESTVFNVRAEDIVENEIENNGYENLEIDDFEGVEELQKALDSFKELNKNIKAWERDTRLKIKL